MIDLATPVAEPSAPVETNPAQSDAPIPMEVAPAPEPSPEVPDRTAQPKSDERQGAPYAALARREAGLVRREQRARGIEQQQAEWQRQHEEWSRAVEAGKADPISFLQQQFGLDFETLVRRHVLQSDSSAQQQQGRPASSPELTDVRRELGDLRKWREEMALQEQDARARAQAEQSKKLIEGHLAERLAACQQSPDDFELVLANPEEAKRLYLGLYPQATHITGGRDLEPDECHALMGQVEKYLTEHEQARLERLAKSKRFGSRFAATPPAGTSPANPEKASEQQTSGAEPKLRTLTNQDSRPIPSPPTKGETPEQRRERIFRNACAKHGLSVD